MTSPVAYGYLALKPWEFHRLQPYEFFLMIDGAKWREARMQDIAAYFVATIVNPHIKKQIKPADLTKPLRGTNSERIKQDQDYYREQFALKGKEG